MSIPGSAEPLLLAQQDTGGYQIQRSLRFNSSDSAFLSRTPASSGNRRTWTWAGWVKRTALTATNALFAANSGTNPWGVIWFRHYDGGTGNIDVDFEAGVSPTSGVRTTATFRDPSAWYHIVVAVDTTQATASNRVKIYVNGTQQAISTTWWPSQNFDTQINSTSTHYIGQDYGHGGSSNDWFNGYLADIHFIDGQALTPSSFTEVSATTGRLEPKKYAGTFGTNGFWLPFSDTSSTTSGSNAGIGKDFSGNGNYWNSNNLSVTAGSGLDLLVDTPTSYGTDTGAGGEVRGNYATWNPLSQVSSSLVNGNLDATVTGATSAKSLGTIFFRTGKWYWEVTYASTTFSSAAAYHAGVATDQIGSAVPYSSPYGWTYTDGLKYHNGSGTAMSGASITNGDIAMFAVDADAGKIWFGKNGTWFESGNPATGASAQFTTTGNQNFTPVCSSGANNCTYYLNAGQRPFAYTAPSGFKALCDTNLPAPVVAKSSDYFQTLLWTGNGVSGRSITGLSFNPDLVWIKQRSTSAGWHVFFDSIRQGGQLASNVTDAELAQGSNVGGYVSAYTSNGFTMTAGSSGMTSMNANNESYVAWCFDAGSNTVSNTAGSITSSVRANASAGFSIVTYTGVGSTGTVGHGLGVAPSFYIVKARTTTAANSWRVYHSALGNTKQLFLESTSAESVNSSAWNNTSPTSTVFSVGSLANESSGNYVAYCFAPVAGYSSFGSYVGNGSADGPFVFTGMRPRWIMFKCSSTNNGYTFWEIIDTARPNTLAADLSDAEGSYNLGTGLGVDILSNGFKIRGAGSGKNLSSQTYIYFAVAENPFQYARAR